MFGKCELLNVKLARKYFIIPVYPLTMLEQSILDRFWSFLITPDI